MTAEPAKVLIVDDHPLVREGLASRVGALPDFAVCGEAADIETALRLVETTEPDLMIVDLALKGGHGLDLIKRVKRSASRTKMLVLSVYDEALFAERALRAGAHGYVNKQEAQQVVVAALRKLLAGEHYVSPQMTETLVGRLIIGEAPASDVDRLSDRELQIFELIGRGTATRDIAKQLRLSIHTVETHRERIRAKLNLDSGTELTQRAVRWVIETG
jgi:DNA-binding NarL/FixJ family response regulator